MQEQKILVIVGPPKSGKTHRAEEEARKIGGSCVRAVWEDVMRQSRLETVLASSPRVVIVEGVQLLDLVEKRAYVKKLVGGDSLTARRKFGRETFLVDAPVFIFTAYDLPQALIDDETLSRRIEVIDLKEGN